MNENKLPYKKFFHTFVTYKSPSEKGSNHNFLRPLYRWVYVSTVYQKRNFLIVIILEKNGLPLPSKNNFYTLWTYKLYTDIQITKRGWANYYRTF